MTKKKVFENETKVWYKSKTIWINGLMVVGAIFTDISSLLGTGGTLTAVGVANIVLRAVTKSGVTLK